MGMIALFLSAVAISPSYAGQNTNSGPARSFASLSAEADAARDADHLEEAVSLYHGALTVRPAWAEGWWSLATIEYERDRYAKAAAAFEKYLALKPQDGTAHAMLGLCDFDLGHQQAALRHIQKGKALGLQKNPDLWHVVLYHEGTLLQRGGKFQAAQDTLEELCLQAGPSDKAATVLGMAMLRMNQKDPPEGQTADADVILRVGRAECLAGQKRYDDARPLYEAVLKDHPDYPNVHYAYGLFLTELRDVAGAVEQFKQEIAAHPDNVIARLRIAAVEFKEDSAAGIPYAEEAVRMDGQSPYGHYILGLLRLDVDEYQKAIPELEIAQKGMPTEPKLYLALGTAYSRAGRNADAARARSTFQRLTAEANKSTREGQDQSGQVRMPLNDAPRAPE